MPAGRPPKYRKEYCDQLLSHMGEGLSFGSFGAVIGVSEDTLYEWCKRRSEFSESKKRGRQAQELFYERFGRSAMAGKIENFNATAFVWMTKNMLNWREKTDTQVSGPDGTPMKIEVVVTDYMS